MKDEIKNLRDQLHSTQSKYTYFLLFIASSAIAIVIKITATDELSYSLIPLGLALLSWGYSFYCGCKYVINYSSFIQTNLKKFYINNREKLKNLDDIMNEINPRLSKYYIRQFIYILIGAGFFILWHIWGIVGRTFSGMN